MSPAPPSYMALGGGRPVIEQLSQEEQNRLSLLWKKNSKSAEPCVRYKKAAVLMVSWENNDLKGLDKEMKALEHVFTDDYEFKVEQWRISNEKNSQTEVDFGILKFAREYQDANTLLILYYAGHAYYGGPKQSARLDLNEFKWARRIDKNHDFEERRKHEAAWSHAEETLLSSPSDVVVILDCCYAGVMSQSRGLLSRFEYLCACSGNHRTSIPGETSFTHALTWALKELKDGDPFTLDFLLEKVKKCKTFPPKQQPIFSEPCNRGEGPISLCPSNRKFLPDRVENSRTNKLDLRFHLPEAWDDDLLVQLAQKIDRMIAQNKKKLAISHVGFLGKNRPYYGANGVAEYWRGVAAEGKRLRLGDLSMGTVVSTNPIPSNRVSKRKSWKLKFPLLPLGFRVLSLFIMPLMSLILLALFGNVTFTTNWNVVLRNYTLYSAPFPSYLLIAQ